MKSIYLIVLSLLLSMRLGDGRKAYKLTDSNFEHDTQQMGKATTGDWLVLFCEKEAKPLKCKQAEDYWDELSGELYGRVTVAFVDT